MVLWWYCRDLPGWWWWMVCNSEVFLYSFLCKQYANDRMKRAQLQHAIIIKNMHQRVYQPNPARANRSNSARYSQGHGIWAFQNVQLFWPMNVVQSRDNPSWQEGQQHFHKLKTTCSQSVDLIAYSVDLACFIIFIANLVQRCQKAPVKLPTSTRYRDIRPCKGTQQIGPFDCDDTPRDSKHGPRKRI